MSAQTTGVERVIAETLPRTPSKKLRFEIFKRDSFTCQYCGRKAPEVVLQCDHIEPAAEGGTADILNLITACFDCNLGKGARRISDQTVLAKQVDQLQELQERREQIEMMIDWRDELLRLSDETIDTVAEKIREKGGGRSPNENGRSKLRRWIKKYGAGEVLIAADDAFDAYLRFEDNRPTDESWEIAFVKIPTFLSIRRQEVDKPYIRRLLYIQAIVRNRSKRPHYDCLAFLEHVHLCGMDLDKLERGSKRIYGSNTLYRDFEGPLDDWLREIGKPF